MPRKHRRRRSSSRAHIPSKLELVIVVTGLILAVAAGVIAYRIVGLYGDGPFASGYHRLRDPDTGESLLVHESRTESGVVRRVIEQQSLTELRLDADADGVEDARVHVDDGNQITRVDRDHDGDGQTDLWEYYDESQHLVKAGFSLAGDGVLDAWAFRDEDGQLLTIEVSTRRDGTVDRWEHYEDDQLARVEEDTDHDGHVDRWSTYDGGILMETVVDTDGDGEPDQP